MSVRSAKITKTQNLIVFLAHGLNLGMLLEMTNNAMLLADKNNVFEAKKK